METCLPPIEKPRGLVMKIAYYFSRRQPGKVMTSIRVFAARMPSAFGSFYGKAGSLDKKLRLLAHTAVLIREHVASLNLCAFCELALRNTFGSRRKAWLGHRSRHKQLGPFSVPTRESGYCLS